MMYPWEPMLVPSDTHENEEGHRISVFTDLSDDEIATMMEAEPPEFENVDTAEHVVCIDWTENAVFVTQPKELRGIRNKYDRVDDADRPIRPGMTYTAGDTDDRLVVMDYEPHGPEVIYMDTSGDGDIRMEHPDEFRDRIATDDYEYFGMTAIPDPTQTPPSA